MLRWVWLVPLVSAVVAPSFGQQAGADLVEVKVAQALGSETYPFVVTLAAIDGGGDTEFRVTDQEALDIAMQATGAEMSRPMSHDLLHHILDAAGLSFVGAVLETVRGESPPSAGLWTEGPAGLFLARARAGDAVASALALAAPILVSGELLAYPDPPADEQLAEYTYASCEQRADPPPPRVPAIVTFRTLDDRQTWGFWLSQSMTDSMWLAMPEPAPERLRIHDTIAEILKLAGIPLKRLVIGDIIEQTIMGTLVLDVEGGEAKIDCRPSDGICIALRAEAPIYLTGASAANLRPVEAERVPVP